MTLTDLRARVAAGDAISATPVRTRRRWGRWTTTFRFNPAFDSFPGGGAAAGPSGSPF